MSDEDESSSASESSTEEEVENTAEADTEAAGAEKKDVACGDKKNDDTLLKDSDEKQAAKDSKDSASKEKDDEQGAKERQGTPSEDENKDISQKKAEATKETKSKDRPDAKPEEKPAAKSEVSPEPATSSSSSSEEKLVACGVTISEISDQDKLHEMLEQCDNFDERRKIRARLMTLMQEARARREQASRRRLQHQQQRDGGCVSVNEAQMINDWLSDNFDSDGKETVSETKTSASSSATSKTATSKSVTNTPRSALNKGKAPVSAFDKFKQLDSANPKAMPRTDSNNSDSGGVFKLDPGLAAKAQGAKEMTLYWVQSRVRDYQNVNVSNFSTSWNDGMAFCALIHHFYPDAFDFNKLNPKNRRYNFDLAFKMAEEKAGIYPLLDTDDMVAMKKPDWKCVFTYVQAIYRRLKDGP